MVSVSRSQLDYFEQWCPELFLTGGVFLLGHAAVMGVRAFTDLATPPDVFVMVGHLVALSGLLGLSPMLLDHSPRLIRGATYIAVLTLAGWAGLTGVRFLELVGIVPSLAAVVPGAILVLMLAVMALAYALFGVAVLRGEDGSRRLGFLVLAPGALLLTLMLTSALIGSSAVAGVVFGGGFALAMLTLGYSLRSWHRPIPRSAATEQKTLG